MNDVEASHLSLAMVGDRRGRQDGKQPQQPLILKMWVSEWMSKWERQRKEKKKSWKS